MSLNVRQNKNQLLFKTLNKEDFEKYEITNQPIMQSSCWQFSPILKISIKLSVAATITCLKNIGFS